MLLLPRHQLFLLPLNRLFFLAIIANHIPMNSLRELFPILRIRHQTVQPRIQKPVTRLERLIAYLLIRALILLRHAIQVFLGEAGRREHHNQE